MVAGGDADASDESLSQRHVSISFFTKDKSISNLPETSYEVPISSNCENLNTLVNTTIRVADEEWADRRFEFLVGDTFVRSTIEEFIEEYNVETETTIKVECVLGAEAPQPKHDLPAPDWVSSIQFTKKHIISTTYSGDIVFYTKNAGEKILTVNRDRGAYKCSAVLKDAGKLKGTEILVAGESQVITLYNCDDDQLTPKMVFRGHERSVECLAVSPDSTRLVSGAFDKHLKVWNLQEDDTATVFEKGTTANEEKTKRKKENFLTKIPMVTLSDHRDAVVGVTWSTWNAAQVISASWDNSLVVWDLELAGEVSRIRTQKPFTSLDINANSSMVIAGSCDNTPRLFDVRSKEGSLVKQAFVGHRGWVSSVKWNPHDDRTFVSASFDNSVKMWDIRSSKTSLFDLHGHEDRVLCCAWSDDGLIASGSVDATVKVFDTVTGGKKKKTKA